MKASIIIPNFNGELLLTKNLPYVISAMNNEENNIMEIIVVDDGSWDGSIKLLKDRFPQVKVIKHKINRGFSAAVNTGVRGSAGDLLVLLNSDVVPSEDFLVHTLPYFKNPKIFAVSFHEKGYGWARGGFKDGYIQILSGEESESFHESFYVSGGSGVFMRSIWMELGGMDEELLSPFYWEDIDLCFRAEKRGYITAWEPNSHVVHNHESTMSKLSKNYVARIKERNQLLCLWKNLTSPSLVRKHMVGLFARLVRHPGYIRVVLMAIGRLGIALKKKKKEIKESKVSDEAIFGRFS
jgi:GT2 family glycosyltransferase